MALFQRKFKDDDRMVVNDKYPKGLDKLNHYISKKGIVQGHEGTFYQIKIDGKIKSSFFFARELDKEG